MTIDFHSILFSFLKAKNPIQPDTRNFTNHFSKEEMMMSCFHLKTKDVLFACCLVGVFFLPACQQDRSDLEIYGRWRSSGHYYDFNEDGTWAVGYLFNDNYIAPFDWGAFSIEGNKITFSTDQLASSCPGLTGTYEFEFPNDNDLIFILVEEECGNRSEDFLGSKIQRDLP